MTHFEDKDLRDPYDWQKHQEKVKKYNRDAVKKRSEKFK